MRRVLWCCLRAHARVAGSVCDTCEAGRFGDVVGAKNCTPCQAGSSNSQTGQTSCSLCPAGTSAAGGNVECVTCPNNQVTEVPGSAKCVSCGGFSRSNELRTECLCDIGLYRLDPGDKVNHFVCDDVSAAAWNVP